MLKFSLSSFPSSNFEAKGFAEVFLTVNDSVIVLLEVATLFPDMLAFVNMFLTFRVFVQICLLQLVPVLQFLKIEFIILFIHTYALPS